MFTIWYVKPDGSIGKATCSDFDGKKGSWQGIEIDPTGKQAARNSAMQFSNDDELQFTPEGAKANAKIIWKRK
jgi:hypothetical protein